MHQAIRTIIVIPVALLALTAASCDDPTEIEEHAPAEGIAIVVGGGEIYRYVLDDGPQAPTLTLAAGTYDAAIVLLDQDGEPLPHADEEDEEVLVITIEDPAVLSWTAEADAAEHEQLEFHGQLDALQPGTTTMEICLLHGGHCDFEIQSGVPVVVTQ